MRKNVNMDGKWTHVAPNFVQKDLVKFVAGKMSGMEFAEKVWCARIAKGVRDVLWRRLNVLTTVNVFGLCHRFQKFFEICDFVCLWRRILWHPTSDACIIFIFYRAWFFAKKYNGIKAILMLWLDKLINFTRYWKWKIRKYLLILKG